MDKSDEEVAKLLKVAKAKPDWARTKVPDNNGALRIQVRPGTLVITSEGVFEFEQEGDWILLPTELWSRTLTRLRLAEPRLSGKGDGGPKRRQN